MWWHSNYELNAGVSLNLLETASSKWAILKNTRQDIPLLWVIPMPCIGSPLLFKKTKFLSDVHVFCLRKWKKNPVMGLTMIIIIIIFIVIRMTVKEKKKMFFNCFQINLMTISWNWWYRQHTIWSNYSTIILKIIIRTFSKKRTSFN